jgi:putative transcriptional regulator
MSAAGEKILGSVRGLRAAVRSGAALRVHVPEEIDVRAIRKKLGMSQRQFAAAFGFGVDAVQNWEQGRRRPEGAARAFLKVIDASPTRCAARWPPDPDCPHPGPPSGVESRCEPNENPSLSEASGPRTAGGGPAIRSAGTLLVTREPSLRPERSPARSDRR